MSCRNLFLGLTAIFVYCDLPAEKGQHTVHMVLILYAMHGWLPQHLPPVIFIASVGSGHISSTAVITGWGRGGDLIIVYIKK
jgi:hypothetical protein